MKKHRLFSLQAGAGAPITDNPPQLQTENARARQRRVGLTGAVLMGVALVMPMNAASQAPAMPLSTGVESGKAFDTVIIDDQGEKRLEESTKFSPNVEGEGGGITEEQPLSWSEFTRKLLEEGPTLTRDNTKRVILEPPSTDERVRSAADYLVREFKLRREIEGRFLAYITKLKAETPLILDLLGLYGHTAIVETSSKFLDLAEADQRMFLEDWSAQWHKDLGAPSSRMIITDRMAGRLFSIDRFDNVKNTADPLTIPLLAVNERVQAPPPAPPPPEAQAPAQ